MQWILLVVMVAALLYMSRFYPKAAFGVLGVLVIGALVIVFTTNEIAQLNRSRLPVEDIKIENPVFTLAYGDGFRFNARLINTHESVTLKETTVSITLLDCPQDSGDAEAGCQVIGQADQRILVKIPPGQARDVSQTLSFGSAKLRGHARWRIKITETRS
ncbi:hypothetical protein [Candidatus Spongiihabitans sp.]|uniref:hypothetical protein n=1 Tax=Candidatus Spongiihabitans sp. TaxID=3101308 RepID=UPI003C7D260F